MMRQDCDTAPFMRSIHRSDESRRAEHYAGLNEPQKKQLLNEPPYHGLL